MAGKKIEVDETAFLNGQQLAQTVQKMLSDPKARRLVLEAQKIVLPNVAVPEIDAAAPVMGEVEKLRAELEADKKARAEERAQEESNRRLNEFTGAWERGKQTVRQHYPDLNDEGIKAIEDFAKERGIPDIEAAAALWRRDHPPAMPEAPGGSGGWNFFEAPQDDIKGFMEKQMATKAEDDVGLDRHVRAVLQDIRGQRRAA